MIICYLQRLLIPSKDGRRRRILHLPSFCQRRRKATAKWICDPLSVFQLSYYTLSSYSTIIIIVSVQVALSTDFSLRICSISFRLTFYISAYSNLVVIESYAFNLELNSSLSITFHCSFHFSILFYLNSIVRNFITVGASFFLLSKFYHQLVFGTVVERIAKR